MDDNTQDQTNVQQDNPEPDIIILGLERKTYYVYKGEEFLNDLLLADGEFPTPVLCVHFETLLDAKRIIGESLVIGNLWAVHHDIIERLRVKKLLAETDA